MASGTKDEKALIERSSRDPEAFRELYRHHLPRVYAYVASRMGSSRDAEDIVAETFLTVIEHLDRFEYRGAGSFGAWLFRIAHSRVADFHRRHRSDGKQCALEAVGDIRDEGVPFDDTVAQAEQLTWLRGLVRTLTQRQQDVVTLKFYGGLRNCEIAEVLELDERVVATHLSNAIRQLRRKYEASVRQQEDVHRHGYTTRVE